MKSKYKYIILSVTALLCIIVSYIILPIASFAILFLSIILFVLYNAYIRKIIFNDILIADKRNKRNFKKIVLGSTDTWRILRKMKSDSFISFAFYRKNIYTNFETLKHEFSYLSLSGEVCLFIDLNDRYVFEEKVRVVDALRFHRIVVKSLNISNIGMMMFIKFPIIYAPVMSIKVLFYTISKSRRSKKCKDLADCDLVKLSSCLSKFYTFCNERNIILKTYLISMDNNNNISKLREKLKDVDTSQNVIVMENFSEMKSLIN